MSKKITIYGWEELNEVSFGQIMVADIDEDLIKVDKKTKEVSVKNVCYRAYSDGQWFINFSTAKKEMIKKLQEGIDWRKQAIKQTRKILKKNNVGT